MCRPWTGSEQLSYMSMRRAPFISMGELPKGTYQKTCPTAATAGACTFMTQRTQHHQKVEGMHLHHILKERHARC